MIGKTKILTADHFLYSPVIISLYSAHTILLLVPWLARLRAACLDNSWQPAVLAGEGTFHQFYGGVTTSGKTAYDREQLMKAQRDQYIALRGSKFSPPKFKPTVFGEITPPAYQFIKESTHNAMKTRCITTNKNHQAIES